MNNDLLYLAASEYQNLSRYEYLFVLMRKGMSDRILRIRFSPSAFYHLAGLQYTQLELTCTKLKKRDVFKRIIHGSITMNDLDSWKFTNPATLKELKTQRGFYDFDVPERIRYLCRLDDLLDNVSLFVDYHDLQNERILGNRRNYECTLAKMISPVLPRLSFAFFIKKEANDNASFLTFFPQRTKDYTISQTALYLKAMIKVRIKDNNGLLLRNDEFLVVKSYFHQSLSDDEKQAIMRLV